MSFKNGTFFRSVSVCVCVCVRRGGVVVSYWLLPNPSPLLAYLTTNTVIQTDTKRSRRITHDLLTDNKKKINNQKVVMTSITARQKCVD